MGRALLLGAALLAVWSTEVCARNHHVRLILDISKTMNGNDPGEVAKVATMLLYDLVDSNDTTGDTFKVMPFDPDYDWKQPDKAPVQQTPALTARRDGRPAFEQAINAIAYDGWATSYYPAVRWAADDMSPASLTADVGAFDRYDSRTIILLTDGDLDKSDAPGTTTRWSYDGEAQLLGGLIDELAEEGIGLHTIAFGPKFQTISSSYRQLMEGAGKVFPAKDGSGLIEGMLRLFAYAFGYQNDGPVMAPGGDPSSLLLNQDLDPERVAVVRFVTRQAQLSLDIQQSGSLALEPERRFSASGASYSARWVKSPPRRAVRLGPDPLWSQVAVLRPAPVDVDVVSDGGGLEVMARTRTPQQIRVSSRMGALPGEVQVSYRERVPNALGEMGERREKSPCPTCIRRTADAELYDIDIEYPEHPETPTREYQASLEAVARRGGAGVLVGELDPPKPVLVWPYINFSPTPSTGRVANGRRSDGTSNCASFRLLRSGTPYENAESLVVRATLNPTANRALSSSKVTYTLDGEPLSFAQTGANAVGAWANGRDLPLSALEGDHELCVSVRGARLLGAIETLTLNLVLAEPPYDRFPVFNPFEVDVNLKPPTGAVWLYLAVLLAPLAVATWIHLMGAGGGFLPGDLVYWVSREGAMTRPVPVSLGKWPTAWAVLLPKGGRREVLAADGHSALGTVRPVDKALFEFRPAKGVALDDAADHAAASGAYELQAGAVHRVKAGGAVYLLRFGYQHAAAASGSGSDDGSPQPA